MFASRVLPPIRSAPSSPLPPPVATFFSVPRRYVKCNMPVGSDTMTKNSNEDVHTKMMVAHSSRKNSKVHTSLSMAASGTEEHPKDESPSPVETPRTSRKQISSLVREINADDTEDENCLEETKTSASTSSSGPGELSATVCLCQPEEKIRRPRNAFILYRQHHQHDVVHRHPGLNNPEISKIIGEQWQAESDEQKKYWQDLAQEEKARHQEKYPDYRYQPRRLGKPTSSPLNPTSQHGTVDKYRCSRCGGRSIRTPISPSVHTPTLPPLNVPEGATPTTRCLPPMMSNIGTLSIDSPGSARRAPPPSSIKVSPLMREDSVMYSPVTPGFKRPRHDYDSPSSMRRNDGSYYPQSAQLRRESMPLMHVHASSPNTAGLQPPCTPHDASHRSAPAGLRGPMPSNQDAIPHWLSTVPLGRISTLRSIAPPLGPPENHNRSPYPVRGAIIAIEGDEVTDAKELTSKLNECLGRDKDFSPRVADGPKMPSDSKDTVFEDYLDLIRDWHDRSKEMIKYITTPPVTRAPDAMNIDETALQSSPERKGSDSPISSQSSSLVDVASNAKPVLLLPTFHHRASSEYAARICYRDAYNPNDHWQWIATLWRGIVGPDLTVYVKTYQRTRQDLPPLPISKIVELDENTPCLCVMREQGSQEPFPDAVMRRVAFEICEWMRRPAPTALVKIE